MCGVLGIISKKEGVGFELCGGLQQLQHRGYEAAGVLTLEEKVHLVKGMGLVSDVLDEANSNSLTGKKGIAQVRYTTTAKKKEAQPFFTDFGGIGLAHNGHIINRKELRKDLEKLGFYFESEDCDAEEILKLLSYAYFKNKEKKFNERLEDSLKEVMETLVGAYSVVSVIKDKGLLAFKDPLGIRPLSLGEKSDDQGELVSYGVASESIALKKLGYHNIKEMRAGTAIFIDHDLNKYEKEIYCLGKKSCMFEWVYFARASSWIEGKKVNRVRYNLGRELAYLFNQKYPSLPRKETIVVPVPETSYPTAKAFSEYTGFEYKLGLEKTRSAGRLFLKPKQDLRESATLTNLEVFEEVVEGKIVVLVDDSIIRGTTSTIIVEMVKNAGAKEVYVCSANPRTEYPCYYGIDTPTREELIASNKNDEEISETIKAKVVYNSIESLIKAIDLPKEELCLACLNGKYPTDI